MFLQLFSIVILKMPPKIKKSSNVKVTDKSKKTTKTTKKISQKVSQVVKINIGKGGQEKGKGGSDSAPNQPIFYPQQIGFPQVQTSTSPLEAFARKSEQESVNKQINALEKIAKEQSETLKGLQQRIFQPMYPESLPDLGQATPVMMPSTIQNQPVPLNVQSIPAINNASSFTVQGNKDTLLETPVDRLKRDLVPRININDQTFANPDAHESFQGLDRLDEESVAPTEPMLTKRMEREEKKQPEIAAGIIESRDIIRQLESVEPDTIPDLTVIKQLPAKNASYAGQITLQRVVAQMKNDGYSSNVSTVGKTRSQYIAWIQDAVKDNLRLLP